MDEAQQALERMLWFNPTDNQGARSLHTPVAERRASENWVEGRAARGTRP